MDKDIKKVFTSSITRSKIGYRNDFADITKITPAKPLTSISNKNVSCDYKPTTGKYYIPKNRIGIVKVKTVRDIRNTLEKDVYSFLSTELEKQRNMLLRKIRCGLSKSEKTKNIAKNILKSDIPISKAAWHMLININPNEHVYPKQFILWNGKYIQLNGSKGGNRKFICNYDIGKVVKRSNKNVFTLKSSSKKKSLLQHSLKIEFKPGPLTRKKYLDTSYQKYQFGDMELVNLPKPGLEIQPAFNKPLGPLITKFLYQTFVPDFNSNISEKWAEFAVSVLGTNVNGNLKQLNKQYTVSFDLSYKRSQNRLLMRHDSDMLMRDANINKHLEAKNESSDLEIVSNVKNILDELIKTVDISINQDQMFSGNDEPRYILTNECNGGNTNTVTKPKRKINELERLDVTVIRISERIGENRNECCKNDYCSLGCICSSLQSSFKKMNHCGKIECMFNCKCGFLTYDLSDYVKTGCSEVITDFINIDKRNKLKLAKEEQKFHQTVIVTDDKSILLKTQNRDWKTPKKYSEFYTQMQLKPRVDIKKNILVTLNRLNLKNVEPFCMIHKLYKCFCKGIFTNTNIANSAEISVANEEPIVSSNILEEERQELNLASSEHYNQEMPSLSTDSDNIRQGNLRSRRKISKRSNSESLPTHETSRYDEMDTSDPSNDTHNLYYTCARFLPYAQRKYDEYYYKSTNKKIKELEQNDKRLQNKMLKIIANTELAEKNNSQDSSDDSPPSPELKELLTSFVEGKLESSSSDNVIIKSKITDLNSTSKRLPYKAKLVSWLEYSYRQYKIKTDQGILKSSLDPPKAGKLMLYSWDFILTRYRERKNYFMTSKQKPFRIFLAVDMKNSFFEKCVNISDIPWSDLHKYPITIKNLLTNATGLLDNFCILYGLSNCWELIGSVSKVSESRIDNFNYLEGKTNLSHQSSSEIATENSKWLPVMCKDESKTECTEITENKNKPYTAKPPNNKCYKDSSEELDNLSNAEIFENKKVIAASVAFKNPNNLSSAEKLHHKCELSKWFLMNIENDFSEIQFYQKGFFVKHDSIIKAIDVARSLNKTVRLSSQKCNVAENESQFGIYAIPIKDKYCVFIGPYEKSDFLGIETVKNVFYIGKNKTRGIWITTNKVDNVNVIEDPLSFLPSEDTQEIVPLINDNNFNANEQIITNTIGSDSLKRKSTDLPKLAKPIKITKTNGFYQLSANGLLQQISPTKDKNNMIPKVVQRSLSNQKKSLLKSIFSNSTSTNERNCLNNNTKSIADIPPQVKSSSDFSTKKQNNMFVLKPEEINNRLLVKNMLKELEKTISVIISNKGIETVEGVEQFLDTSTAKTVSNADIYVISDDDDEEYCKIDATYDEVYILCKNINIGWIPGKQKSDGHLSFEFPGFKETEFYTSSYEAFEKINQVLSRKVYVPKKVKPKWTICKEKPDVAQLQLSTLHSDYVLTNNGFRLSSDIEKIIRKNLNVVSKEKKNNKDSSAIHNLGKTGLQNVNKEPWSKEIEIQQEVSKSLENETEELWSKSIQIQNVMSESLKKSLNQLQQEHSDKLVNIRFDVINDHESLISPDQLQQERTLLKYLQTLGSENTLKSADEIVTEALENKKDLTYEMCEIGAVEITPGTSDELNTLYEVKRDAVTNKLRQENSEQLASVLCEAKHFEDTLENT